MKTSVKRTTTSVSTIRYMTLPRGRLSSALDIRVRACCSPPIRRCLETPARTPMPAIPAPSLGSLTAGPQVSAGEDGEHQHEDHAERRCAVVVACAAHGEGILGDQVDHRDGVVVDAGAGDGSGERPNVNQDG